MSKRPSEEPCSIGDIKRQKLDESPVVAKKDGSKKGSSEKSALNCPSKAAEKGAGKQRFSSRAKKTTNDSEAVVASPVGGDNAQPSGQRRRKRCPKGSPQMFLCEVCCKEDCGECSNCKNRKLRHQACKYKPKEKCRTYMIMLEERNGTSSNDVEGRSTAVTSSERSSTESEEMNVPASNPSSLSSTLLDKTIPESVPLLSFMKSIGLHSDDGRSVLASNQSIDSQSSNSQPSPMQIDTSPDAPQTHNVPQAQASASLSLPNKVPLSGNDSQLDILSPMQFAPQFPQTHNMPQAQASTSPSSPNEVPLSEIEDDFSDPEIEKMLRKAFLEGIIRLHIIKCGISGPPETGKSHVRALMKGSRHPKQRQSTAIATEADQVTMDFDRIADKEELIHMKKSGSKSSMAKILAKTIHNEDYITRVAEQTEASSHPPCQQQGDIQNLCRKVILDIKYQLKSMKGKPKRKRRSFKGIRLLYIVNTGGPPQFQEILPNFVKCSINLLVHNLSQDLDAFPQLNYVVDGKRFTIPERMQVSNITIIEQSVRSITSVPQVLSARPHIAIIGTFKDKCQPNSPGFEEMLKRKSAVINESLKPYIGTTSGSRKCGIFSPNRSKEQRIFAIDGSEQGWNENGDCLDKLKGIIHEYAANITQDVPMKYFIFLKILKDYAKKMKMDFLKLYLCNEIAASADISMSSSDVKGCLKLFNDVNLILYFPEVLEDVVFIKPEFLLRRVSDLIVASLHCEDEYDVIREERAKFHQTGVFTETILRNTRSLQMPDGDFTQKDLLTLLKGLFIIAEVGKGKYFMPCVLPTQTNECLKDIQRIMEENGIDGPLTLSFGHKMSPRGIFCSLIVSLARMLHWKLLSSNAEDQVFHRNLIQFEIFPCEQLNFSSSLGIGRVVLVDMNSHIDIYTTCTDKSLCPDIRRAIQRAFVEACINMSYSLEDLDVRCGFPCIKSEGEGHNTSTLYNNKKREWLEQCRICGGRSVSLNSKRVVWFHDGDFSLSDKIPPTMELLCNKISPRTNEWKAIAINLEMSFTDVERISMENISVQESFTRVFDAWEQRRMRPYTWGTMVSALRSPSVNELSLAQDICDEFCRPS